MENFDTSKGIIETNILFLESLEKTHLEHYEEDVADFINSLLKRTLGTLGRYVLSYENKKREKRLSPALEPDTFRQTESSPVAVVL